MKRAAALIVSAAMFAACTPKPKVTVVKPSSHAVAVATLQKVNTQAHDCWMTDKAFKSYGLIPELDTTGTPRILVIPKGKPQALPKLVIASNGRSVSTFGPLAEGDMADRINADVARWASGSTGCAA
jgi:hypothetical protein